MEYNPYKAVQRMIVHSMKTGIYLIKRFLGHRTFKPVSCMLWFPERNNQKQPIARATQLALEFDVMMLRSKRVSPMNHYIFM